MYKNDLNSKTFRISLENLLFNLFISIPSWNRKEFTGTKGKYRGTYCNRGPPQETKHTLGMLGWNVFELANQSSGEKKMSELEKEMVSP